MLHFLPILSSSPATGDHRNIIMYITLAIISAIVIVVLWIKGRKKW